MVDPDDILHRFERDSMDRHARVLDILHEEGRPDLAGELEAKFREIATGVDGARSAWQATSPAQRRVMEAVELGRWLRRAPGSRTQFDAVGGGLDCIGRVCGIATLRNLTARELLACDGGVFDPEAKAVLTERGRFVLGHGRPNERGGDA